MHTGNADSDHPPGHGDHRPLALLGFALVILCLAALRGAGLFSLSPVDPGPPPRLVWLEGGSTPGLHRLEPDATMADLLRVAALPLPAGTTADQPIPPPVHGPVVAVRVAPGRAPEGLPRLPPRLAPLFFQPIPLNQADAELLAFLPGIGPKLAARIVEFRGERGGFTALAELDAVQGIGPATLKTIAEHVVVE